MQGVQLDLPPDARVRNRRPIHTPLASPTRSSRGQFHQESGPLQRFRWAVWLGATSAADQVIAAGPGAVAPIPGVKWPCERLSSPGWLATVHASLYQKVPNHTSCNPSRVHRFVLMWHDNSTKVDVSLATIAGWREVDLHSGRMPWPGHLYPGQTVPGRVYLRSCPGLPWSGDPCCSTERSCC